MIRMRWSWPDLCALPADYVGPLHELLQEQDAEARLAARNR